ncbi:hypothetical protein DI392_19180 [Vibrio albus]|jgi:hypothetical protein|uniref:Uncharacterized protein n=1 Tax=Vibrio albus TaxID=2200953 RepID=A0A2U3B4K4_9VIBR|nr:hypothetical protein [Vibrio albus]PWI31733.1 hypothetical protein DI392_19180 [Vibrio albus]
MQRKVDITVTKYIGSELIYLLATLSIYYGTYYLFNKEIGDHFFAMIVTISSTIRVIWQFFSFQSKKLELREDAVYLKNEPCEIKYTKLWFSQGTLKVTSWSNMVSNRLTITKSMISERNWKELLNKST